MTIARAGASGQDPRSVADSAGAKVGWIAVGLVLQVGLGALLPLAARAADPPSAPGGFIQPVTPNAAPEAVALLKFIQEISGKHTLAGQHNYPNTRNASSRTALEAYGKSPAIFGQDFGFSAPGDIDSVTARPGNIAEVVRQYKQGALITLCWHAVRPIDDEPATLDGSVQAKLTDQQWHDVITPGTELYKRWCAQVDVIAAFLKELQAARVPVLWRPYHEMNGDWFWWGGRPGESGSVAIYRQLFDRLVNYHQINNLIWLWNVDRPVEHRGTFAGYFPGARYFDIATLDVYEGDFNSAYYDGLFKLAAGKPIALAEVAPAPTISILETQPKWTWWMIWAEMLPEKGKPEMKSLQTLVDDPRSWSLSDAAYVEATAPIRAASGLPARPLGEQPLR